MRLIKPARLLTLALLGGLAGSVYAGGVPDSERITLSHFYDQTGGAGWIRDDNWGGAPGSECSFFGVVCNSDQTHVIGLQLAQNQLTGTLPADLNRLTNLTIFDVHSNALAGPIPPLTGLTNLTNFNVSSNALNGSIPALTGLTSLTVFDAAHNQLDGSIPALTGLTNLTEFFVDDNQFTGPIPALTGLANLDFFSVTGNQLEGPIPALNGLTNLGTFYVDENQLSGPIPALTGLTNLRIFDVDTNALSGSIPALDDLTALRRIDVGHNRLTGSVPAPPNPAAFGEGASNLCPNPLDLTPSVNDDFWNFATGFMPWWKGPNECEDVLFENDFEL